MDKDWQKFTMTGSVQDYLSYCSKENRIVSSNQNKQTGERENGTNNYSAWNGDSRTAYR